MYSHRANVPEVGNEEGLGLVQRCTGQCGSDYHCKKGWPRREDVNNYCNHQDKCGQADLPLCSQMLMPVYAMASL